MNKNKLKKAYEKILCYSPKPASRNTVRRYYENWRNDNGLQPRCDNPQCFFYNNPLIWNGSKLNLILDHIDGNKFDNRPEMLRYLCPNCDSQQPTRGGANKGRIINKTANSFKLMSPNGKPEYTYFGKVSFSITPKAETLIVQLADE